MKTIGNILWIVFTGLWSSIAWIISGLICCITIICIPFGKQCFKFASLAIWPMGREVYTNFEKHPIANIIWLIFGGLEMAFAWLVMGVLWCITIVGIPFGKQCFKLAKLSIMPFGASIN